MRQEKVSPSWKVRLSVQLRCMSREAPQKLTFGSSSPAVQLSHLTPWRAEHPFNGFPHTQRLSHGKDHMQGSVHGGQDNYRGGGSPVSVHWAPSACQALMMRQPRL